MVSDRRNQILLGALAVVLATVVYRAWPQTSTAASPASNQSRPAGRTPARAAEPAVAASDVRLDALEAERPKPEPSQRNLFLFKPKSQATSSRLTAPTDTARPASTGPLPPPPAPPITLKFIGIIDRGGEKIAVLSDSAGHVDYGGEGAIIGGRYRVLKIGVESIEMAHLDGRGRQTIRLTGS